MSDTQPNVDELRSLMARAGADEETIEQIMQQGVYPCITQAKQQTCDDILGLLPDDNVVTKEFGYNSGEKKFGFRIGVAATIKAIKQYREGL